MFQTIEAVIDEQGNVRLLEPIQLPTARRALVTILEYEPIDNIDTVGEIRTGYNALNKA